MKIYFTKSFKKAYSQRIEKNRNLVNKFDQKYDLFKEDPTDGALRDHGLKGLLLGFRAFSITKDIRIVYYIHNNTAYFVDIGTHNQVYNQ